MPTGASPGACLGLWPGRDGAYELSRLYEQALTRWVPAWLRLFVDPAHGGFYERLDQKGQPLALQSKRLLTQCRQLFVYSQACLLTQDAAYVAALRQSFAFMQRHYWRPETGLWVFCVGVAGEACDESFDLYAHAFVILALSFYVRATHDAAALRLLAATLASVDTQFRADEGFFERLEANGTPRADIRRQNSHMHLFEACLMCHVVVGLPAARRLADELLELFFLRFFDPRAGTLVEFLAVDGSPHPEWGDVLEPGHHYEWAWLLRRYLGMFADAPARPRIVAAAGTLVAWADTHARDRQHGGIFDRVRRSDGTVLRDTKRIWHVTEALKVAPDGAALAALLRTYVAPSGMWVETKTRDMHAATDYMPGTTPYHLLMGITEAYQFADNNTWPRSAAGSNNASPL